MKSKPIEWSKRVCSTDDLCGKTHAGYWDIIRLATSWVIYSPTKRIDRDSTGTKFATRDAAKTEAERLAMQEVCQ